MLAFGRLAAVRRELVRSSRNNVVIGSQAVRDRRGKLEEIKERRVLGCQVDVDRVQTVKYTMARPLESEKPSGSYATR